MKTTLGRAVAAYAAAAVRGDLHTDPALETTSSSPDFASVLRDELSSAVATLARAESKAVAGVLGKASVQEVVEAVTAAELTLQKVTAVRDRLIAAYQEIQRMPV